MRTKRFGADGPPVSEVGMGCWQLAGDFGAMTDEQAGVTLRAAVEAGITFFDTADVYGGGRSEALIGRFLRDNHTPLFVATKFGRGAVPGASGLSERFVRGATEASLQRLGVDALDLTQVHSLPADVLRNPDLWGWLGRLRDEGKIRRFGASVETVDEALLCLEQPGLASLQIIFNVFRQKPIAALHERARKQGVAIIVRLPLASGLLAGKYQKSTRFEEGDHRNYNRDGKYFNVGETFAGLPFETGVELADGLKPLAPAGMTLAQMALRFCLDFDAVTTIIPGAKSPDQVHANAAASALPPLGAELHQQLADYYAKRVAPHIRGAY
jgi:aryl-alcohol dehydrogenase-like predicted oxidoreductase